MELRWSASGTDWVLLEPFNQTFPSEGSARCVLQERTVFWLHVSNSLGGESIPLVVDLLPPAPVRIVPPAPVRIVPVAPSVRAGGIWIQFAALAEQTRVQALLQDLREITGNRLAVFEIQDPDMPGRTLQRVRMGPFRTLSEAKQRLRQLRPRLGHLDLQPYVATD